MCVCALTHLLVLSWVRLARHFHVLVPLRPPRHVRSGGGRGGASSFLHRQCVPGYSIFSEFTQLGHGSQGQFWGSLGRCWARVDSRWTPDAIRGFSVLRMRVSSLCFPKAACGTTRAARVTQQRRAKKNDQTALKPQEILSLASYLALGRASVWLTVSLSLYIIMYTNRHTHTHTRTHAPTQRGAWVEGVVPGWRGVGQGDVGPGEGWGCV